MSKKKIILTLTNLDCAACVMNIDGDLEETITGITSAKTNYAKQQCVVEYEEASTTITQIVNQIKKTGYEAKIK